MVFDSPSDIVMTDLFTFSNASFNIVSATATESDCTARSGGLSPAPVFPRLLSRP